jgi:hypothetical protein
VKCGSQLETVYFKEKRKHTLFIIPIFWLLGLWVRNSKRLLLQPILRLLSFFVNDFERSLLHR